MNGYDGMLMSSVNAMDSFHKHFGTEMQGSQTGILFSIYAIGTLAGAAVSAPASDTFGRRFGMSVGSMLIIVGAGLEAAANELSQFIGGRFLIGMGVNLANTAAVIYLVEIALPHWRGTFGGLYNVVGYYTGSLCTSSFQTLSVGILMANVHMKHAHGLLTEPDFSPQTGAGKSLSLSRQFRHSLS